MKNLRAITSSIKRAGLPRLIIPLLVLIPFTATAQRRERLIENWKPLHYDVNITLNDQLTEIQRAQTTIDGQILKDKVDSIGLDFGSMTIDSITVGSNSARYDRTSEQLNVHLQRM